MRLALKLHPESRSRAVTRIDVDVLRPHADELVLRYAVTGEIGALLLPAPAAPVRTDELWKHTCFEVFVRDGEAYAELNFSPSTQWAAYRFSGYRAGMTNAEIGAPRIETQTQPDRYELQAIVTWPGDRAWKLALSGIIEENSGEKSYWALAHPEGKPDFHHADSFAFVLPAAEQT